MNIVILPILVPLLLLAISIVVKNERMQKWIRVGGSFALAILAALILHKTIQSGILVLHVGGWHAPFGITLVSDMMSSVMLLTASFIVFCLSIYSLNFIPSSRNFSRFNVFFFALIMGVNGAFITGDVFNLYVWFEVMLLSSFVLITMGGQKDQLEGGIKYMALNLIGSLLFLAGLGMLYGKTGTLNMAHLAQILKNDSESILMNTSAVLFFVAFGIKAAIFPLYFWLPSSYHTPNIAVTSLFAGLLTKVGVYALIRFFTLFFVQDQEFWHMLLLIVSGLTMVIGGMAASTHYETRRILSYHIISQIGYMIMGLGIYTPLAIAGAVFFMIHNMIAKTNTFLIAGVINKFRGTYYLKDIGGLFNQSPLLAVLFIIPAFALAGIPPLSGFFGKFILIKAGIEDGHYLITAVAVLTGMLTLYSMIKIWNEAFLKPQPEDETRLIEGKYLSAADLIPSLLLGLATILMGIFAKQVFGLVKIAADQLMDSAFYIEHVL